MRPGHRDHSGHLQAGATSNLVPSETTPVPSGWRPLPLKQLDLRTPSSPATFYPLELLSPGPCPVCLSRLPPSLAPTPVPCLWSPERVISPPFSACPGFQPPRQAQLCSSMTRSLWSVGASCLGANRVCSHPGRLVGVAGVSVVRPHAHLAG